MARTESKTSATINSRYDIDFELGREHDMYDDYPVFAKIPPIPTYADLCRSTSWPTVEPLMLVETDDLSTLQPFRSSLPVGYSPELDEKHRLPSEVVVCQPPPKDATLQPFHCRRRSCVPVEKARYVRVKYINQMHMSARHHSF